MREQLRREGHRRLALVCLALSRRATMEHAVINIDPSMADCWL